MRGNSEIIQDLRYFPCLSVLNDVELCAIGDIAQIKKVAKNEQVFMESEPMKSLHIVKTGSVKLYKSALVGRELIFKIMGPGDYFCCAPAFVSGKYFVSAMSLEDSVLIVIPINEFKKMIFGDVNTKTTKIITGLCNRIQYLSKFVEELTFKDVEQRILIALLRLAEKGSFEDDAPLFFSLTHQDIASMIGTVREVVSRVMSKLKKEGVIIESTVRGFKIDKERLVALSKQRLSDDILETL